MVALPEKPTLQDLQKYVSEVEKIRGFSNESALEKCLLLGEEIGELYKAIRIISGIKVDPQSKHNNVAEELADILNFTLAIANRFDVDLAEAFQKKEAINNLRIWR